MLGLLLLLAPGATALVHSPTLRPVRPVVALRGGSTVAVLPGTAALAVASLLPTTLGFWRTGYAVSYGYGGAMAASGLLMLRGNVGGLARAHAAALVFYGVRLCLFLLYRELFTDFGANQMTRKDASLRDRLKRAPVIIGCSFLYYCMAAPLRLTAICGGGPAVAAAVGLTFLGFGVAAAGDTMKAIEKARKGPDTLVTTGIFKFLRHPNYTGEMIGWSASLAAAVFAAAGAWALRATMDWVGWMLASVLGWVGIFFVLAGEAAAGLEKKQKEKYGGSPEYEEWVKSSWAGPVLSMPKKADE